MATELDDLSVDEVSLVDEPANKGSRVLLWKRAQGSSDRGATVNDIEGVGRVRRLMKRLGVGVADLNKVEETDVDAALKAEVEKLAKAVEALTAENATLKGAQADVAKANERRNAFKAGLPKNLQAAFGDMKDEEKDEFEKRYVPGSEDPVSKALKAAASENATLSARLEKIESDNAIAKVQGELAPFANLIDVAAMVPVITKLRKSDPAAADLFVTQLKTAHARVETAGLFKTLGRDSGVVTDADSAIDKAVADIRKGDPKLSEAEAMTKALEQNPALYDAYNAEKDAR